MLLIAENFDDETLASLNGFVLSATSTIQPAIGKNNSSAMFSSVNSSLKKIVKTSKRLVFGGYFKVEDTYLSSDLSYNDNYGNRTIGFDFGYEESNYIYASHFSINININVSGKAIIDFYTEAQTSTTYPKIESATGYVDIQSGYFLIEIYLDLQGADSSQGRVKVALNGITYADIPGIITGAINQWIDGENSPLSHYNFLKINYSRYINNLDSMYVCNEELSFHNDFIGPYDIATLRASIDGDQTNWERQEYGRVLDVGDVRPNVEFVTKTPFDKLNAEFKSVTASQTLTRDLAFFEHSNIPDTSNVIAVCHKIQTKGLTVQQLTQPCIVCPIVKASGGEISYQPDYEQVVSPFLYTPIIATYDKHPALVTDWTQEFLNGSQFGYCFFETEKTEVLSGLGGTVTNCRAGDSALMVTDRSESTFISSSGSGEVTISFPAKKNIALFEIIGTLSGINHYLHFLSITSDNKSWYTMPSDSIKVETVGSRNKYLCINAYPGIEVSQIRLGFIYGIYELKAYEYTKVGA